MQKITMLRRQLTTSNRSQAIHTRFALDWNERKFATKLSFSTLEPDQKEIDKGAIDKVETGYALHRAIAETWAQTEPLEALKWCKEIERIKERDELYITSILARSISEKILNGKIDKSTITSNQAYKDFTRKVIVMIESLKEASTDNESLLRLYNFYISTLSSSEQSKGYLSKMKSHCTPNIDSYNIILSLCIQKHKNDHIRTILGEILDEEYLVPNAQTFKLCFQACAPSNGKIFDHKLAMYVLDVLRNVTKNTNLCITPEIFNEALKFVPSMDYRGVNLQRRQKAIKKLNALQKLNTKMSELRIKNAQLMEEFVDEICSSIDSDNKPDLQTYMYLLNAWAETRTTEGLLKAEGYALNVLVDTNRSKVDKVNIDFNILVPIFRGWAECTDSDICRLSRVEEWIDKIEQDEFSSTNTKPVDHLFNVITKIWYQISIQLIKEDDILRTTYLVGMKSISLAERFVSLLARRKGGFMFNFDPSILNFSLVPFISLFKQTFSFRKANDEEIPTILAMHNDVDRLFKTLNKSIQMDLEGGYNTSKVQEAFYIQKFSYNFVRSLSLYRKSIDSLPVGLEQQKLISDSVVPHLRLALYLCEVLYRNPIKSPYYSKNTSALPDLSTFSDDVNDSRDEHQCEKMFLHFFHTCSTVASASIHYERPIIKSDLLQMTAAVFDKIQPGGALHEDGADLSPIYKAMLGALTTYHQSMPDMQGDISSFVNKVHNTVAETISKDIHLHQYDKRKCLDNLEKLK